MERLPPELYAVLETDGYSLLLQGEVGVGKNMLGLELLAQAKNPFYLSLASHPHHVHQRYPWISKHLTSDRILDLRELMKEAVQQPSVTTFQSHLSKMIPSSDDQPPTVFIDGWLSFVQSFGIEPSSQPRWHYAIIDLARRHQWTLILTTRQQDDPLIELVDGVVQLFRRTVAVTRSMGDFPLADLIFHEVRCLDLCKLTSITITRRYYVFSIAGRRFRYLPPSTFSQTVPTPKPILSSSQHLSTGIREFDQILSGGYPRGCATLLEVTGNVARRRHPLIHAAAVNALLTGCGLLYLIEEDIPLDAFIAEHIIPFVGEPKLKHLHFVCLPQEGVPECKDVKDDDKRTEPVSYCQTPLNVEDFEKTCEELKETRQRINERYDNHLEIVESTTLERHFNLSVLPDFLSLAKDNAWHHNNALLFIADFDTSRNQRLRRLADFHLLLDAVEGVPVLKGLTPSFDPYAVEVDSRRGVTLTPIS